MVIDIMVTMHMPDVHGTTMSHILIYTCRDLGMWSVSFILWQEYRGLVGGVWRMCLLVSCRVCEPQERPWG